jgi:hypothetical protein
VKKEDFHSLALRSAGVAFLSTTNVWGESAVFLKRTPKSWRPDGLLALSVLQQFTLFNFFLRFRRKGVAAELHELRLLWHTRNTELTKTQ